jgi:hypothetical protein
MVALYVGGHRMGTLAENPDIFTRLAEAGEVIEFRDESGKRIGKFTPDNAPLVPWDPTITKEELDRRAAEPGLTLDEVKKRLGW